MICRHIAAAAAALTLSAAAAAQPVLTPAPGAVAPGTARDPARVFDLQSEILGESRRVYVDLPESHAASARGFPVIVVFDGDYLFSETVTAARHLAAAGQIPEAIVVGVENVDRIADYTPAAMELGHPGAHGERTADFLAAELLPALAREARGSGVAALVGHSQSAMLVLHALAARPGVFDLGVAIDAPVHLSDRWLERGLVARATETDAPLRLRSLQAKFGWDDASWTAFIDAAPATWSLERSILDRESHQSMTYLAVYLGLRDLFADYSAVGASVNDPVASLARYDALPGFYGDAREPPDEGLRWGGEDLWVADDEAGAREGLGRWTATYGDSAATARLRAKIDAMAGDPLDASLADLLEAPRATAAEIAPLAGTWTGRAWGFGPETSIAVTFAVEEGRAVGEFVWAAGTNTQTKQPLDHVSVDGDVFKFGYMNGMRPRGLLFYTARLDGDRLVGEMTFAGVRFDMPGGGGAQVTLFEMRRAGGD